MDFTYFGFVTGKCANKNYCMKLYFLVIIPYILIVFTADLFVVCVLISFGQT